MKLKEVFDAEYYDYLQDERHQKKVSDKYEDIPNDAETSMADFIVSKYEVGQISYEEALKELRASVKDFELEFWSMELNSAREMKD